MEHRPADMKSPFLPCIAIAGVVILEVTALLTGHNGTLLRIAFIAVAGLGGFSLAQLIRKAP